MTISSSGVTNSLPARFLYLTGLDTSGIASKRPEVRGILGRKRSSLGERDDGLDRQPRVALVDPRQPVMLRRHQVRVRLLGLRRRAMGAVERIHDQRIGPFHMGDQLTRAVFIGVRIAARPTGSAPPVRRLGRRRGFWTSQRFRFTSNTADRPRRHTPEWMRTVGSNVTTISGVS